MTIVQIQHIHFFFKKTVIQKLHSHPGTAFCLYALCNLLDFSVSLFYMEDRLFVVWDCTYLSPSLLGIPMVSNEELILVHFDLKAGWFKGNASVLNS